MTLLRKVGWSCIAFAFMVLAQIGVAFPALIPSRFSTLPHRGQDPASRGRLSAPKRAHTAFAD